MTRPTLYVLTGLPGAGKTWRAAQIVAATGAVHVSMDAALVARGISIVDYDARFRVQPEVEATIPVLLAQGHSVVAEFGSWTREERARLAGLAAPTGARTELHWLDAPLEVLIARVMERGGDGAEVLATTILRDNSYAFERPSKEEAAEFDVFVGPDSAPEL